MMIRLLRLTSWENSQVGSKVYKVQFVRCETVKYPRPSCPEAYGDTQLLVIYSSNTEIIGGGGGGAI